MQQNKPDIPQFISNYNRIEVAKHLESVEKPFSIRSKGKNWDFIEECKGKLVRLGGN